MNTPGGVGNLPSSAPARGIWSGLNFTKDVVVGFFERGWSFVHGLISISDGISKLLFLHGPGVAIKTWKGLFHGVKTIFTTNQLTTLKAIGSGLIKPMVDEWKSGHPGKAIGRGVFEILALGAGTKGLDKLNDLRKAGKGAELLTEAEKTAEAERAATDELNGLRSIGPTCDRWRTGCLAR